MALEPSLTFPGAKQYAFLFENAHLLMLAWDRDDAKFLFVINEQKDESLVLDYPGRVFTDRVLDTVQNIFFIQVQEENTQSQRYVLGSYFEVDRKMYGAYYEQNEERAAAGKPNIVLFRIEGDAPDFELQSLDEKEYQIVSTAFIEQHQEFLNVQAGP